MRRFLLVLVPAAFLAFAACDDDDTPANGGDTSTTDGGQDAGHEASTHDGHDAGQQPADAGPTPVKCTDSELAANVVTDGGTVEIAFPTDGNPVQYTNHCLTVKAGATVTFTGSFLQHPLKPGGGDSPNPIPYTSEDQPDDKVTVTFANAGTFGYFCEYHPSFMFGAVRVVP